MPRPYRPCGGGAFRAPLTFVGWGCERKWGVVFISGGRRIRTCSFSVMSAVCFRYTSPRCAAWLRWGQSAPHTCHARYVRLDLLPVFQGEVPEVLGPLVGCM